MKDLPIQIFVLPVIALFSVLLLYIFTRKRESDKIAYGKFIMHIVIVSFILNMVWELLQGPLYKGFSFGFHHIFICTLGSFADMIIVMIIHFVLALIYKNNYWFYRPGLLKFTILILIGATGAITGEMWHVTSGNWAYSIAMSIIPILHVGVLPILQFMFLPTIIYYLSYQIIFPPITNNK